MLAKKQNKTKKPTITSLMSMCTGEYGAHLPAHPDPVRQHTDPYVQKTMVSSLAQCRKLRQRS